MTPQRPLVPCTEMAPTGSSTFITRSTNSTERQTSTPAIRPMITGADGVDEAAGRGDGHQPGQQAVAGHGRVRLAVAQPHVEHGAEAARHPGQHGVHRDGADAQAAVAGSAQRRAGIESEPAEGQNEAAGEHQHDVVARGSRWACPRA